MDEEGSAHGRSCVCTSQCQGPLDRCEAVRTGKEQHNSEKFGNSTNLILPLAYWVDRVWRLHKELRRQKEPTR